MMEIKEKIEELKSVKNEVNIDTNKIIEEIKKTYRLVSNTTNRIERQLQYIEDKQNKILEILKYKNVDTEEIKKQQEILELENKLRELRGE
ncbi:hypothetical protein [Brassicibacter mesophilus]|uniref:hypothetical protein n=1 Tax=Brassicibacter mesophilus TaxID=745119 RepID=UPI003D191D52